MALGGAGGGALSATPLQPAANRVSRSGQQRLRVVRERGLERQGFRSREASTMFDLIDFVLDFTIGR